MTTAMNGQQIARYANRNGGPCSLLGPVVEKNLHKIIYICVNDRRASIPKRHIHLEPCRNCPDHPTSRYPHLNGKGERP